MTQNSELRTQSYTCQAPPDTFDLGEMLGRSLHGGEVILLEGGLGAGKTLLTKGILYALDYDVDEVTSPSFTLVNRYDARLTVYHLDLWRIEQNAAFAVGLDEVLEDGAAVVIIEWPERLEDFSFPQKVIHVKIEGDGDDERKITIDVRGEL
jgi:tRNA threonylcarbamoyladenosine biosynthesis protein TsaE